MTVTYLDQSVLVLKPKPHFFEWLREQAVSCGYKVESIYHPEQDAVFSIPSMNGFSTDVSFEKFVANIKPLLLKHALSGYGFPLQQYSSSVFDEFFDIEVRERLISLKDEWRSKNAWPSVTLEEQE